MTRTLTWLLAVALASIVAIPSQTSPGAALAAGDAYQQTNLVSDIPGLAPVTDPNLVNPWGLAATPASPFWAADNDAGVSTLYSGTGAPNARVVTVPAATGSGAGAKGTPTGVVFNPTTDFVVSQGGVSGVAAFIFATEDGTISGWNATVNGTAAIREVDNTNADGGAVYKGLTLATNGTRNLLYAANFRAGTVDVFGGTYQPTTVTGGFRDPTIPAGFAPFGIQALNGQIYVTYAKQDSDKHDDVASPGNGFVNVFTTDGVLVRRLASQGSLNSPWGLAIAPAQFGGFSNDVLVGNFGDGRINVFSSSGAFLGQLQDAAGQPIVIPGLWALRVGNAGAGFDVNRVYFTAGIDGEEHGLFGSLSLLQPNVSGGRGFGVSSTPNGVVLTWQAGVGQSGYAIARLSNGSFSVITSSLGVTSTTFTDTAAPSGLTCYWLLALGTSPLKTSDLECALTVSPASTGAPRGFTLRLNQGSTASLTWTAPGGQDSYVLVDLSGGTRTLPGTATSATVPVTGFDCFALQARSGGSVLGASPTLCAQTGLSNLPQ